jgi:hypothetical protein
MNTLNSLRFSQTFFNMILQPLHDLSSKKIFSFIYRFIFFQFMVKIFVRDSCTANDWNEGVQKMPGIQLQIIGSKRESVNFVKTVSEQSAVSEWNMIVPVYIASQCTYVRLLELLKC